MKAIIFNFLLLFFYVGADRYFPENFSFGVSTAAYQVEGGWNADGKGESIWDKLVHDDPSFIYANQNGDVACDTYHHGTDDIQYMKEMGISHYRFSIAWSRILPNGRTSDISEAGIAYYNKLIDGLIENNITPYVTLYHWDLPNGLQDFGGWLNRDLAEYFEDYARICFERFGDRVKNWLTFNEPISACRGGYEDASMAPRIKNMGTGAYECAHTILLSHGRAYRLYQNEFKAQQNGRVSIVIDTSWYEPNYSDSEIDKEAANRNMVFNYEWWMSPVVEGDYPDLIKSVVAQNSQEEGLSSTRLPEFSEDEKNMMRGTLDFVALNQYTSYLCYYPEPNDDKTSSWYRDVGVYCHQPDDWPPGSGWLRVTPWGMRNMLNYIKNRYGNPEIFITENGYSDGGELEDHDRTDFHRNYLEAVLDAIDDGVNVSGYTAWSFLDDFEWTAGFLAKFGLVRVDFDDDARTRTRKYSSYVYENIIKTRKIDWNYSPAWPPQSWSVNNTNVH